MPKEIIDLKRLFSISQGSKNLVGKIVRIGSDHFVDIRRYYIDSVTGVETPTSRGIRLSVSDVEELTHLGVLNNKYFEKVFKGCDAIA